MASKSETGHAKNVAHFDKLISYCTAYGAAFNPSKESIQLPSLNKLHDDAHAAMDAVNATKTAYDNATNDRETGFKGLKKLATKVINALAATDANELTLNDATSTNFKLQGRRSGKKVIIPAAKEGAPTEPISISTSQQSYDTLADNFAKLVQTVSAEPHYRPNESELQISSLTNTLATLRTLNKAVATATSAWSNARITRDQVLYAKNTGMYDIALTVKQYIKSLYGATSRQYSQVSGIRFTTRS